MDEKDLHEHEHHHEHDHEHHHEHDHEHHHHDDECDCGCDHDHEHHHHDDECGCGHDHDHDEHECHDPNCTDPSHHHHHHDDEELVHISHHESSTIGALKGLIPTADYDEAEKQLAAAMREAGRLVTEAGGIIGHIKFVLTSAGKCGQISVTDVDENIRRFDGNTSEVEGVAIVFAVEDDKLREILEHTVGALFTKGE